MPDNKLINTLINLGLSENEAKVYFASLSLGPTTILNIARASETKRTTVYSVVESLKEKGLMRLNIKGFKQFYVAEDPNKLESILESRKIQLQNSLPEFSALYNLKGGEGFIKHYEGLEAVKNIYEELLQKVKPTDFYYVFADTEKWYNTDKKFYQKFLEKRAKKNIHIKILTKKSKISIEHKKYSKNYNITSKFLPEKTKLTTNLIITPNKLVTHQLIPPIMAVVIENKSIINTNKQMFDLLWESIK
ncbi:MAG: TrmB family transcriptional regulator [Candidatus Kerfeldbacteria bacterium]|jgi:sugar-specific transcriptional regulator TrmB